MNKESIEDTKVYTATEARENFSDLFDAAHFGKKVVVKKRGREVAVVSISVLRNLERLVELEAEFDSLKAEFALLEFQKMGGKTMAQIKQELDMD